jgi:hypothetical protein
MKWNAPTHNQDNIRSTDYLMDTGCNGRLEAMKKQVQQGLQSKKIIQIEKTGMKPFFLNPFLCT